MLSPIKTTISQKLKNKNYRHAFFRGRAQDEIAYDLRRFRKERGLNQSELAQLCGMKQSAISRIEQASYSKWNFSTLWRIAEALDVRVRVKIDDMADALNEYERLENGESFTYAHNFISSQLTLESSGLKNPEYLSNAATFAVTVPSEYRPNVTAGVHAFTVTGGVEDAWNINPILR